MDYLKVEELADIINGKNILITGGTGSFGNEMTETILDNFKPKRLVIFSRDEFKQNLMKEKFNQTEHKCIRYFIGDIRDYERLLTAFHNVDLIFHAAALKQVPALEYNPLEAIKTNIYGAENVIRAAVNCGVKRVIAISTDKAVAPVNLYGSTKMCFERLFVSANYKYGDRNTIFSVFRYGNVMGSRGSVIPLFKKQKESGKITITDGTMTRFNLTLKQAINFVLNVMINMIGGEIFVPKIPSYDIMQVAKIIAPEAKICIIGIRPGEKVHESMYSPEESYYTLDNDEYFVIKPFIWKDMNKDYEKAYPNSKVVTLGCGYDSCNNKRIDNETLAKLINEN